ncbi:MAG: hypothetical protein WB772_16005, partial [Xanthobacteraceae bacterium]
MTRFVPASATAIFAEKTHALACQGYDPKLKVFMKKGHANVRFARADFRRRCASECENAFHQLKIVDRMNCNHLRRHWQCIKMLGAL